MWTSVELREIRVFLTLADELHFGRAGERLGITHSRVSQTIRTLEARVGAALFDRTSRRVRLTPIGEQFQRAIAPGYELIERACEEVCELATGVSGHLRLGLYSHIAGGPHLLEIIKLFEARHPACTVKITETGLGTDEFDRVRRGQLDVIVMRMPFSSPQFTIGPVLTLEPRVVVVAAEHPLAARRSVSVEDLADYTTTDMSGVPRQIMDAFSPPTTPSGRPIRRANLNTVPEAAIRAAAGEVVHPTVPSFLAGYPQPGLTAIPIVDLPPSSTALAWAHTNRSLKIQAFARAAADVVRLDPGLQAAIP